jgi:hypothetical protein
LNGATTTGTPTTSFAYEAIILNSASTGTYYIGQSSVKEWTLLDYWYYSSFSVASTTGGQATQEYFFNSSDVYDTNYELVGPDEWVDVIMYDAICSGLNDKENQEVLIQLQDKRALAMDRLAKTFPDLKPQTINTRYRYAGDYTRPLNDMWL